MNIEELITIITEEYQSGNFTKQAVFNRNIAGIEAAKSEGYNYKVINQMLNIGLNDWHFRDLIRKAKGKAGITQIAISAPETKEKSEKTEVKEQRLTYAKEPVEYDAWQAIGITSKTLIKRIEDKTDLTPEIINGWNCANESQITKRVTEYLMKNKGK